MNTVMKETDQLIYEVYKEEFENGERYGIVAHIVERRVFQSMFGDRDSALEVARLLNVNRVSLEQAPYVIEDCMFGKNMI